MRLTGELGGSSAALGSGSSSVLRLIRVLLPSPYHLGPSLHAFSQEENVFVYHVPRHHDYNHTELHQTQDRELVFSCHQVGSFPSNPWFKFKTPLVPS